MCVHASFFYTCTIYRAPRDSRVSRTCARIVSLVYVCKYTYERQCVRSLSRNLRVVLCCVCCYICCGCAAQSAVLSFHARARDHHNGRAALYIASSSFSRGMEGQLVRPFHFRLFFSLSFSLPFKFRECKRDSVISTGDLLAINKTVANNFVRSIKIIWANDIMMWFWKSILLMKIFYIVHYFFSGLVYISAFLYIEYG